METPRPPPLLCCLGVRVHRTLLEFSGSELQQVWGGVRECILPPCCDAWLALSLSLPLLQPALTKCPEFRTLGWCSLFLTRDAPDGAPVEQTLSGGAPWSGRTAGCPGDLFAGWASSQTAATQAKDGRHLFLLLFL